MLAKVFGIGLSRTGTKSLAVALNAIGVKTMWYPHDYQTYYDIVRGHYSLRVLEEYDALTDTPVVPFFPHFDELYPNSKFILTTRNKSAWLQSCKKHWPDPSTPLPMPGTGRYMDRFGEFIDLIVYGSFRFNEKRWSYVFDAHHDRVRGYFRDRPQDLLTIDFTVGDGWDVLCKFLGKPVPDIPFPAINNFSHEQLK